MNIAYTIAPGRGDTDLLLLGFARALTTRGLRPIGTVQMSTERPDAGPCDMDVQVLPDGPVIRISQDLGHAAKGCRLDPDALETAVGLVHATLRPGVDCLIVNKFGKHEAGGRGFRGVIAEAASMGVPILVGLNEMNREPFLDFTGGLGIELKPETDALVHWFEQQAVEFSGATC